MPKETIVDTRENKTDDDQLIEEARERFDWSATEEAHNRKEAIDDLWFHEGSGQWPSDIKAARKAAGRPTEVINKLPGFTDQILGEMRQNKVQINVIATGKPGSKKIADIMKGIIGEIERNSKAQRAYKTAASGCVISGRGCWKIVTEFTDEDTWDQDIRIRRIKNPYTVYFDPAADQWDKRDGRFAFLVEDISRDEFRVRYPGKEPADFTGNAIGDNFKWWTGENTVRVAEYWVKRPVKRHLYRLNDGRVVEKEKFESIIDELKAQEEIVHRKLDGSLGEGPAGEDAEPGTEQVLNPAPKMVRERIVDSHDVEMYLIDGAQIVSGPHKWAGKFIPIIPVFGKEINIEGKEIIRGLTRNQKGSQRMYNYERNAEIERVALAKQPPVRITKEQIKGNEKYYNTKANFGAQIYNHVAGQPAPIDVPPPQASSGNINQAMQSNDEMKATGSIFDASLGNKSNETSGIAIRERKAQGNIANFEFPDNYADAIEFTGEQLVDLIPKIMDGERQVTILGEDGAQTEEVINQTIVDEKTGKKVILNDLSIGKYAVTVTVGPHFNTQREEARTNLVELARFVPIVGQIGSDLIAKNMDFAQSDELAKRLRKTLPEGMIEDDESQPAQKPEDKEPTPEEQAAALELEKKQLEVEEQRLEVEKAKLEVEEKQLEINDRSGGTQQIIQAAVESAVAETVNKIGGLGQ